MRKEGTVSLWLGSFIDEKALRQYLEIPYSDDDDCEEILKSKFGENFNINFYDEDFVEANFINNKPNQLKSLLSEHSYDEIIIPRFIALVGEHTEQSNSIILLYNFAYIVMFLKWSMKTFNYVF